MRSYWYSKSILKISYGLIFLFALFVNRRRFYRGLYLFTSRNMAYLVT